MTINQLCEIFHLKTENVEKYIDTMLEIKCNLEKQSLPDTYPEEITLFEYSVASLLNSQIARDEIVALSGFPLISKDWIQILADYLRGNKCLEIMSGLGCVSYALKAHGIDILATDDYSWEFSNKWTTIEKMDCIDAIKKYAKERPYIILSWPEMNETAYLALLTMRKTNPDAKMIYIGEFGGCCASESFVKSVNRIEPEWTVKINEKFLSWCGIHDLVMIVN